MACNCTNAILSNCSNEDLIALGGIISSIGCSPLGTNLTYMPSPTGGTILSSTGTPAFVPIVNSTNAGLMTPELLDMVLNGGGGGGTVGPGTPNTISKFITPTTIGDSNITDNGTAVTVGVPLTATSFKTPTGGPDQILAADGSIIIAGANITISGGVISANVAGGGGDKNYVHNQGLAAAVWNVTHNLGKLPSVTVINSAGEEVVGEVNHTDNNSLTITFAGGFSGVATMN